MGENMIERDNQEFAVRKRDLCRKLLEFLSEIREAKWIVEEKVRKALTDNEEYRWIIKMADTIEDDYEFLIYHTEDEGKKVIDEIQERMRECVREFNKKCSCKQFG